MVNGPSPGPASADQARASSSRLPRSSWRTWPLRKLRRKVPRVDGDLTVPPRVRAVPPVRNTSASSMQSPPASAEATSQHLVARIGAAWRAAQVKVPVNQLGQAQMQGQGGWQDQPSVDHQAVVVKGDLDAVGVLLVWGRFCVSETIIPEAQEHFLTPSARRDTHLFGGLGVSHRRCNSNQILPTTKSSEMSHCWPWTPPRRVRAALDSTSARRQLVLLVPCCLLANRAMKGEIAGHRHRESSLQRLGGHDLGILPSGVLRLIEYPSCIAQGSLREALRSIASYLRQPLASGNSVIEAMRSRLTQPR